MATVIVDTDSSSTRDYATLAAAITGEAGTLTEPLIIECRATTGVADTAVVNVTGITTTATNTLTIKSGVNDRASHIWDTDNYILTTSTASDTLLVSIPYVIIDGLQIKQTHTTIAYECINMSATADNSTVKNCFLVGYFGTCLYGNTGTATCEYYNLLIVNLREDGTNGRCFHERSGNSFISNLTCISIEGQTNITTALYMESTSDDIFNCYIAGTSRADEWNCVLSTAPVHSTARGFVSLAQAFASSDPIGDLDFTLAGGSPLRNFGSDQSTTFTDDINGTTRVHWDVGVTEDFQFSGYNDLTLIHAMDNSTDTVQFGTLEEELQKEGAGCGSIDIDIELIYVGHRDTVTSLDVTDKNIYIWGMSLTASYLDTWENGGIRIRAYDTSSNSAIWYVSGSDVYQGGWVRFVCNTGTTPDEISGTVDLTDIMEVNLGWKGIVKSKLAVNCFTDAISYGADGEGLTLVDGTASDSGLISDIIKINEGHKAGIVREKSGVMFLNGTLNIGDSVGTKDAYFEDFSRIVRCEDKYRTFTTTNRTSAESLVSSTFFQINVIGNSTGTTSFILGEKSGTQGISGLVLSSPSLGSKLNFDIDDTNVDYAKIYATKFQNANLTYLPDYVATDKETLSCTWSISGLVDVGTGTFKYNSLISSPTGAAAIKLDNASNYSSDCQFIGCDIGVELSAASTYTFTNMEFS